MSLKSLWMVDARVRRFHKLSGNLKVDAVVIGGGIAGVTAAYLLKKGGLKVALLERDRCARGDTGHTTAHLTYVTDTRLGELVKKLGRDHAQAAWDAGAAALDQIEQIVRENEIDCDFRRVPGYLHAPLDGTAHESEKLREEARLASQMGFEAAFEASVPMVDRPGIRFANQGKFHPLKYIAGLLPLIAGRGSHVFEGTAVEEVTENPTTVRANGCAIRCKHVVVCTHVPLVGKTNMVSATLFQTKLTSFSSYALSARIPKDYAPEASFWDTANPYFYLRIDRALPGGRYDTAVFGGLDHKTGQEVNTEDRFRKLESVLLKILPRAVVTHRWTGQVVETPDGLPFIGESAPGQFVATGFGGNGMTFGMLAGMMACDAIARRKNPWKDLFDVHRKPTRSKWNYLRENLDYPYYMMKDRLGTAEGRSLRALGRGKGMILRLHGERVAAYRSDAGKVTTLSPLCTHMGCIVQWNPADSTWDCPCHGSRFKPTGQVLAGPAETPLAPKSKS